VTRTRPDHGERFVIRCPSARRLKAAVADISRRRPQVDDEIAAIRQGGNQLLLEFVPEVQDGDPDAANLVLWALMPQACGYMRTRTRPARLAATLRRHRRRRRQPALLDPLVRARLELSDQYPTGADRMAVLRAERRLTAWRNAAA
jgi:hypothetical protein